MDGGRGGGTAGGGGGTVLGWLVSSLSRTTEKVSSGLEASAFVSELFVLDFEAREVSPSAGVRVVTCFTTFFLSLGAPLPVLVDDSSLEVLGRDDDDGDEDDLEACTFFTWDELAETRQHIYFLISKTF